MPATDKTEALSGNVTEADTFFRRAGRVDEIPWAIEDWVVSAVSGGRLYLEQISQWAFSDFLRRQDPSTRTSSCSERSGW
jgi:hypothetical protein